MDSGKGGDAGGVVDAALIAREFRVSLEHRRDIDDLVADAVAVRQRATIEATEIVRSAEALAREIIADARKEASRLTAEAAQTLKDASERYDRADAAHSEQLSATIGLLESMASDVQMVLDSALAEVVETLTPADRSRRPAKAEPVADADNDHGVEHALDHDVDHDVDDGEAASEHEGEPDSPSEARPTGEPEGGIDARSAAELRLERWRSRFRQTR